MMLELRADEFVYLIYAHFSKEQGHCDVTFSSDYNNTYARPTVPRGKALAASGDDTRPRARAAGRMRPLERCGHSALSLASPCRLYFMARLFITFFCAHFA